MEFSSLEPKNYIGKFGFNDLAFIEKESNKLLECPNSRPFVNVTMFDYYI